MKKFLLIFSLVFLNCISMEKAQSTKKSDFLNKILLLAAPDAYKIQKINSLAYDIVLSDKLSEAQKIDLIKILLEFGFDINANLLAGFTALHYAVSKENPEVCEFLVKNGANPHIENCDSETAYRISILHPYYKKMSEILEANFDKAPIIYRPGMNRRKEDFKSTLDYYNEKYNLQLELGERFE